VQNHFYDAYKAPFFWCAAFAFMAAIAAWWIDDHKVLAVLKPAGGPPATD
jgi:hypothetical protein